MNQNSVFFSYPNQKLIGVNKAVRNKENVFASINSQAMFNAMRNLKSTAFKLWLYFAENKDGFRFYLSGKHACLTCGIGKSAYHDAFKELTDKYYLIQDNQNKNHYEFYEIPHDDFLEEQIEITVNKCHTPISGVGSPIFG